MTTLKPAGRPQTPPAAERRAPAGRLATYIPALHWLRHYRRADLPGDLVAGVIVAIMLVPQGMAYALLAGLPPQAGLYASIAPLIIYGLLGSSRTLAVGPVAIVSLLVATGVGALAEGGTALYWQLALTLALLVAILQTAMGLLRVGFLVNFLSHPVLTGFTAAAAILIGASQLKHLLGLSTPRLEFVELLRHTAAHLDETNLVTLGLGVGAIGLLFYFKSGLGGHLARLGVPEAVATPVTKAGPLLVVVVGTFLVWSLGLDQRAGVSIVGTVPAGLPPLTMPLFALGHWSALLPTALTIAFVGYMESISVAKSLASRRRQKVDANQELIALGLANVGSAFSGGYPVTGGFSRSVVNFSAGANTGLASLITAGLVALTVLVLTPLFFYLPNTILAAVILVAVAGLIDVRVIRHTWRVNRADALSLGVTFAAVLLLGIELGIVAGVGTAIVLMVWRTSKPHTAVVGRMPGSELYRNVKRHAVQTWPGVIAMRIDDSLYFSNTRFLEDAVLSLVAEQPEVRDFILIGTAINFIDASAMDTLAELARSLRDAGVQFHLAAIKGPVHDQLRTAGLVEFIGETHIHLSTHAALCALGYVTD